MSYIAIADNLKNVKSISLELMSPEEMLNMSFGEVLTPETINYRTAQPQMNGLFCQAIFGPIKDWECACGKYKRYRYAGVTCDKCGVKVTESSVRRQRMGHITLASPCVHPWYLRVVPSRIAMILDMKTQDINKVAYFSSYVITEVNENIREEYLEKVKLESEKKIKEIRYNYDQKIQELGKQFQRDKARGEYDFDTLKAKNIAEKDLVKQEEEEYIRKIEIVTEKAIQDLGSLKYKDVIPETTYQDLTAKFGPVFKASIGGEAIDTLLKNIDLPEEMIKVAAKMQESKGIPRKKIAKRLKLIKSFINSNTHPDWMVFKRIMVLPPDLRPMLQLDGGRFAASDLNELYRRLINRNNRLRKLIQIGVTEVILRNEQRMLQEALEALIDNSPKNGKQVMASTGARRPLKSLTDNLKGKQGRFRQNLLGKRVDYSGRSVIIVGPKLEIDECGLPKEMALELFKPFLIGRIIAKSEKGLIPEEVQCFNVHSARRLIEAKNTVIYDILDEVIRNKFVLLNRAPTLHKLSFMAFKPVLVEGKAIQLHPLVCRGFNADFDGDMMGVHVPITLKGQEEASTLMNPRNNLLKPSSGELITSGAYQDIVLGLYCLTFINEKMPPISTKFSSKENALLAYQNHQIHLNQEIQINIKNEILTSTAGRVIFNQIFPDDFGFQNVTLDKKTYEGVLEEAYDKYGQYNMSFILDKIKDLAYYYATNSGVSFSTIDLTSPSDKAELIESARNKVTTIGQLFGIGFMSENDRYKQVVGAWTKCSEKLAEQTKEAMDPYSNVGMMINSKAKGNVQQLALMVGIRGLSSSASGKAIELPAQHSYLDGLTGLEYFITTKGQRKGQADISLKTADAGYLTRRLVDAAQNLIIMGDDCGTQNGIHISELGLSNNTSIWKKGFGRYLLRDIEVGGEIFAKAGDFLDKKTIKELEKNPNIREFWVRSSTKCDLLRGVCKTCYGMDLASQMPVELGKAVGIIGAQSLGENGTQLTMNQGKHSHGLVLRSDITQGLARVEEVFEARQPKYKAPASPVDGIVESVKGTPENGYEIIIKSLAVTHLLPFGENDKVLKEDKAKIKTDDELLLKSTGELIPSGFIGKLSKIKNFLAIDQKGDEYFAFNTDAGYYPNIKKGEKITRGTLLTEGGADLQNVLDRFGLDLLQDYIITELTSIYAANGIFVDDRHIEIIIKQMCGKVQIIDAGESDQVENDVIRLAVAISINKKLALEGKKTMIFKRVVTGISQASLTTESFLSAASFQNTAQVLVEAVISGRQDNLLGLKENVILGQLIPAGTGFDQVKILNTEVSVEEEFDLELEEGAILE